MMSEQTFRPWTRRQVIPVVMGGMLLLAGSVGFSQDDPTPASAEAQDAAKDVAKEVPQTPVSALTGRITDTEGKPIDGALVRCVIPTARLRFPIDESEHRIVEATTDRSGSYGMLIEGLTEVSAASIDVKARGYRRLVGTLRMGGDPNEVAITSVDGSNRRADLTDDVGQFRLTGITPGESRLRVVHVPTREKHLISKTIDNDIEGETIKLEQIETPLQPTVDLLGMKLIDVNENIAAAFELSSPDGVMVVDPGNDTARFEIGDLKSGNVFWMVGKQQVANLDEMLEQLAAEAESPATAGLAARMAAMVTGQLLPVRVVYRLHDVRLYGTNTQHMRLTPEDIKAINSMIAQREKD